MPHLTETLAGLRRLRFDSTELLDALVGHVRKLGTDVGARDEEHRELHSFLSRMRLAVQEFHNTLSAPLPPKQQKMMETLHDR